jgi:hypothetical protein
MDPWLETQLRLADRRGVLQGPSLSLVQERAVELLLLADVRDRMPRVRREDLPQAEPAADRPPTPAERDEMDRWVAERSAGVVSAAELDEGWR